MKNEILTPGATAAWLLLYTVTTLAGIFIGQRLFLVKRRPLARWCAGIVVALNALWLLFTVLALVYPHPNHETEWVAGRPELNYPIDIALGVVVVICAALVWRRAFRVRGTPSPAESQRT
jgi:amino acid transporter